MMVTTRRLVAVWPLLICALLAVAVTVFAVLAALNSAAKSKITTISELSTPLAAPATGDTLVSDRVPTDDAQSGGSTNGRIFVPTEAVAADADALASGSVQVLPTDRSADIIIPTGDWSTPALIWHEPWEESVWVPYSYWRTTHHVEVYSTRQVMGSVCFDGTPLPSGLTARATADFVAAHGGGYSTGVVRDEVYLLRPAYVERELVQGGTYRQVRHEGYWSYN